MAEKAKIVEDSELDWLLKVTRKTSGQHGIRNVAMILTLFGTGLKPGELGALRIADVLASDGEYKGGQKPPRGKHSDYYQSEVRAEIAFNGRARPLRWNNKRLTAALDEYFTQRIAEGRGTWEGKGYRGLNPESHVFLSRGSEGFSCRRSGTEEGGEREQYSSLSNLFSRLFKNAGVMGAVAGSARRTIAVKLNRNDIDLRVIAEVLGTGSISSVRKLCAGDTRRLGNVLKDII